MGKCTEDHKDTRGVDTGDQFDVAGSSSAPMPVELNAVEGFDEFVQEQEGPTRVPANDPPSTTPTKDEHVSGQHIRDKRKAVDSEAQVMADVLTNFGLLYAAKEDTKIEA